MHVLHMLSTNTNHTQNVYQVIYADTTPGEEWKEKCKEW